MFTGETELNQQVRVDWNGKITLPLSAQSAPATVTAAGESVSGLAARISEAARGSGMLVQPRVQVLVLDYASQTFVVLGQVGLPGRYAFPRGVAPKLDLEEAIALAGGYTRLSRQSHVVIKRGAAVQKVDLRKLATSPGQPPFVVRPGDIITVPERIF